MGERKKKGHISLWVEPEFKKILQDYSVKDRGSLSNLIFKILDDWIKERAQEEKEEKAPPVKKGA